MDHDISQMKKNKLLLPLTLSSKQEASNGWYFCVLKDIYPTSRNTTRSYH
jgi:hypothetical protein